MKSVIFGLVLFCAGQGLAAQEFESFVYPAHPYVEAAEPGPSVDSQSPYVMFDLNVRAAKTMYVTLLELHFTSEEGNELHRSWPLPEPVEVGAGGSFTLDHIVVGPMPESKSAIYNVSVEIIGYTDEDPEPHRVGDLEFTTN